MANAWDHTIQAWTHDVALNGSASAPAQGVLQLARIYIRPNQAVYATNIGVCLTTAAVNGAASIANSFVGLYDSSGNLLTNSGSADQSTTFQGAAGFKSIAMGATQLLQPGKNYWIALLIGTQATTAAQFARTAATAATVNANLTNSTARFGTISTALTALPSPSIATGSIAFSNTMWACVL